MKDPCDIVAGENVLYVSECEDKLIHRIQLPEETVSNWSVDGTKLKLSITKNRNVIAAGSDPAKIYEYTSGGVFVRQIGVEGMMKIHPNLIGLQHAIQLEGDKFLVCHSTTSLSRVCIIDNTGAVIKCYAGNEGPGTGQLLDWPCHLAIGWNGSILVADRKNNRIVEFNASLKYMNEFVGFKRPIKLLLNHELKRLYITELDDQSITILYM